VLSQYHARHIALYATLDIGDNGTDPETGAPNNQQLYVWLADVPIMKAYTASIDASGNLLITEGYLETGDIGCILQAADGTVVQVSSVDSAQTGSVVDVGESSYSSGAIASTSWSLGNGDTMTVSQSGTTVTIEGGTAPDLTSADERKPVFLPDGRVKRIKEVLTTTTFQTDESETLASTAAGMNPTYRKYTDHTQDAVPGLRSRIRAWTLQQRAWTPIPNANLVLATRALLFSGVANGTIVHYSEITRGWEHLCGYHNELAQVIQTKNPISDLVQHKESVIIRCVKNTEEVLTTSTQTVTNEDIGESHVELTAQNPVDTAVGAIDWSGTTKDDRGIEVLITQEPAIRIFDGRNYSDDNLADGHIQKKVLRKLQPAYSVGYHPHIGLIIYGSDDMASTGS
jgi:hypothetical protein